MSIAFSVTTPDGRLINTNVATAIARGAEPGDIAAAFKAASVQKAQAVHDGYRARMSSASPGRLAEWRVKEGIAADETGASAAELALLDREAAAMGLDRATLLAGFVATTSVFRELALELAAMEKELIASIAAATDDPSLIEDAISALFDAASTAADATFASYSARLAA